MKIQNSKYICERANIIVIRNFYNTRIYENINNLDVGNQNISNYSNDFTFIYYFKSVQFNDSFFPFYKKYMEASFRERIGIQLIAAFPDVCRQIIVRFLQLPRNEFSARRHVGLKYGREDSYPSDRGNLLYSRKEERGNFRPIEFDRSLYRKTLPIL